MFRHRARYYCLACANTTNTRAAVDTSMGKHNLNMVGDMPVAHGATMQLLQRLLEALHDGSPQDISQAAIAVASHCDVHRPRRQTIAAIVAACRAILEPDAYPTSELAASASGAAALTTRRLIAQLRRLAADESGAEPAASSAEAASSSMAAPPPPAVAAVPIPAGSIASALPFMLPAGSVATAVPVPTAQADEAADADALDAATAAEGLALLSAMPPSKGICMRYKLRWGDDGNRRAHHAVGRGGRRGPLLS